MLLGLVSDTETGGLPAAAQALGGCSFQPAPMKWRPKRTVFVFVQ
jgi:hypothetical protein